MATTTKKTGSTGDTGSSARGRRSAIRSGSAYKGPRRQMRRPTGSPFAGIGPTDTVSTDTSTNESYDNIDTEELSSTSSGIALHDFNAPLVDSTDQLQAKKKNKEFSPEEIEKKEKSPTAQLASPLAGEANDTLGAGYVGSALSVSKLRMAGGLLGSRRSKLIAGSITGGALFSIATVMMLSGPAVALDTFRQMILNRPGDIQANQSIKYRRSKISSISDLTSRQSRLGSQMMDEMQSKGYRFTYGADGRTVDSIIAPNGRVSTLADGFGREISDFMESRHPFKTARWKTSRTEALYKKFGVSRRPVSALTGPISDPDAEVNKSMARSVLTDEITEDIGDGRAPPDETDEERATREAREQATRDELLETDTEAKKVRNEIIETGRNIDELQSVDRAYVRALPDLATGASADVINLAEQAAKGSVGSRVWSGVKGFLNPTDILDKICTLKNRLRMSTMLARNSRAISMLKYAGVFIGIGDDIRKGRPSSDKLDVLGKKVLGVDSKGNTIASTTAFALATKGTYSKSRNNIFKAATGVDGKPMGFWGGAQAATDSIPGTSRAACGVIQNPIFQVGSTAVITFGKAALCAVSFGTGCAASTAVEQGAKTTATTALRTAIRNSIRSVFTKRVAANLALTAAVELSFEGALIMMQYYIEKGMALNFTTQEIGGDLGQPVIGGGSIANNIRGYQGGLVPVSSTEYSEALTAYMKDKKEENKQKSFFARILDRENPDSLAANITTNVVFRYGTPALTTNSTRTYLAKALNPSNTIAAISNKFTPKTYAAEAASDEVTHESYVFETGSEEGKDVAIDINGHPIPIARDDIAAIDPETNRDQLIASGDIDAETYEPSSERFRKHMENCVENMDVLSQIEFEDTSRPEHDCLAKLPITIQFKAHLMYLDMIDSVKASFDPGSISTNDGGDPATTGTNPTTQPGTVNNPSTIVASDDTTNIPCAVGGPGTVQDGYIAGRLVKIRVCNVQGFQVNSQISKQFDDMSNAARTAGISFVARGFSGSFRSMESQIAIYQNWCRTNGIQGSPPPYPKPPGETIRCPGGGAPGYSNHQMGLAVDLGCDGVGIPKTYELASRNRCFQWLQANAARFGFYELGMGKESSRASRGYEGWHWSVNGN